MTLVGLQKPLYRKTFCDLVFFFWFLLLQPDISAIEEYRAKHAEYLQRAAELDGVTAERDATR